MKTLITLIVCCTTMLSVYAQGNYNTVTLNYNGQNRQVLIDGKSYTPVANTNYDAKATTGDRSYNLSIVTNDLAPGTHKLTLVRPNNRRNIETSFILRADYDLTININGNGSLQKMETYRRVGSGGNTNTAMTNAKFNALVAQINRNRQATTRYNMIVSEFNNSSNYFATSQARRLIQLISGEPFRLQLAKLAVPRITDTRNLNTLTTVLASQAGRNELLEFIRTNANTGSTGNNNGTTKVAISANAYNTLYEDIRGTYQQNTRFNALQNAFGSSSNHYFYAAQISQLVQLITSEAERLQLLKTAFARVVDSENFTQTYTLLNSLASREDLAYYVRVNGNAGGSSNTGNGYGVAMSEANFNSLLSNIRSQYGNGVRKRQVMEAFANTNNFFTVYQVSQLVQLESEERDRLDLAKASLRSIADRQNITLLYNAFTMQSTRDELAAYINAYNNGTLGSNTGSTYRTPMSDANFATLLDDTRRLWIPGAKKATVLQAFASSNNYFTTAQVIQLVALDNDEDDRFEMAKASYKTVVDPQNFARVYDLFTSQNYKNELANYVKSIQ